MPLIVAAPASGLVPLQILVKTGKTNAEIGHILNTRMRTVAKHGRPNEDAGCGRDEHRPPASPLTKNGGRMRSPAALALFCVVVTVAPSSAQAPGPHAIPKRTLFTARAVSGEVFPRVDVDSDASATGAFIISADAKTVA